MPITRPAIQVETLVIATTAFLLLAMNAPFWTAALRGREWADPATWAISASLFAVFGSLYFIGASLVATRHTVKPLLTGVLLLSALAAYYMNRYAVYFDRAMLRNVFATNYHEARELLGWDLARYLLAFGVIPSVLVWWPRLEKRPLRRALAIRAGWVIVALAVAVGIFMLAFADLATLLRNRKEVRHLLTPGNVIAASVANAFISAKRPNQPRLPVAADAALGPEWKARTRPLLFVLVVGETARAQNFSLNGYGRQTNPQLASKDIVNFDHAQACGTSTEVSLPCMFSPYGRRHYDEDSILGHESLLHVLARAGFDVRWRDNQSGCKGVCAGLPMDALDHAGVESLCAEGQCFDEILLHGMDTMVRDSKRNLFVVLHQLGSHGPAYFKRYPAIFKRFSPACENEDLRGCSAGEILNAYDNSLLYTDYFLSRVISFLEAAQMTHDTAMLYMSDHGESLGEGGLYLHGVPYAIAPDVQKHVPMVVWLSPAFQRGYGVGQECLRGRASEPTGHDQLFHSILGVLDVRTTAYDPGMDLFAPCRTGGSGPAALKRAETAH
ncbi:MAG TPA: phosphoethanolamine--lipid A transferase [Ramlibacter sp.]|nr:phosphoethanolamine--lipid A transferase [Ramlibacter sp.]